MKKPADNPSHALWVELETRITSQVLTPRSGSEEIVASSVHALFDRVRDLMTQHPEDADFNEAAKSLLNVTLRSFTARWHRRMTRDGNALDKDNLPIQVFRDEGMRRRFREEYAEVQKRVRPYVGVFRKLAEGGKLDRSPGKDLPHPPEPACAELGAAIPSGIDPGRSRRVPQGLASMLESERQHLIRRRRELGHPDAPTKGEGTEVELHDARGLAFSGGGIRSATFCLGIASVLARRGLLLEFDYLSTVSGGSYLGSFLSAQLGTGAPELSPTLNRRSIAPREEAEARVAGIFSAAGPRRLVESWALARLRNRSRYLLDDGVREKVANVGMVLAGVLLNILVLLPLPLLCAVVTVCFQRLGYWGHLDWVGMLPDGKRGLPMWDSPASISLLFSLGFLGLMSGIFPWEKLRGLQAVRGASAGWLPHGTELSAWTRVFFVAVTAVALSSVAWLLPLGFRAYVGLRELGLWSGLGTLVQYDRMKEAYTALSGIASGAVAFLAARRRDADRKVRWWRPLVVACVPAFLILVYSLTWYRLMLAGGERGWSLVAVVASIVGLLFWSELFFDANYYSPHGYHRQRLRDCYLMSRRAATCGDPEGGATMPCPAPWLRLQELGQSAAAPYHLINTTLNLPTCLDPELRERGRDFFVFSRYYCGSRQVGYHRTEELEAEDPHLDLGTVMAISGEVASSNMGWLEDHGMRFLLTVTNVRLGYWLWNPARGRRPWHQWAPGPSYLFREMFALRMDERQPFLNLSDGGHIENLAVYELLRRRCKFIVCIDGGMDPRMECAGLFRLERYAKTDLEITMHYDLEDLRLQENGYSKAYGILVKIDYSPPGTEAARRARAPMHAEWGWMLYLKLAMVGGGPGYVMDYKRVHPEFPHQSTGDQVFDEAQFEAYRALGEAAAESFFSSEVAGEASPATVRDWFQALATRLLPDNDEVFRRDARQG